MVSFQEHKAILVGLDDKHSQTVQQALMNILSIELAEFTYAQILDGLPTEQTLLDISRQRIADHPVFELRHVELCSGFLEKARSFRSVFDSSGLMFSEDVLAAFQEARFGSKEFNLRLIELVVVACHQIGASLFELDDGAHRHKLYDLWQTKACKEKRTNIMQRPYSIPPAAFFHQFYQNHERYPRGLADVVGYWAEGMIFGGVVVFDRGESGRECKDMWIHGIRANGPQTLYPPTADQFDALISFLLTDSPPHNVKCPLPIHGTRLNRPRWDPFTSMHFHIFRDQYERKIPLQPHPRHRTETFTNWPELEDCWVKFELMKRKGQGEPVDEEVLEKACQGVTLITQSSPIWPKNGL